MTEEMIRSITEAEEKATEIKRAACDKAAQILDDAERQSARMEKSSQEVCRAYRESQMKNAREEAETRYQQTLIAKEKEARAYCADVLKKADVCVSEIVGRIVRGDC